MTTAQEKKAAYRRTIELRDEGEHEQARLLALRTIAKHPDDPAFVEELAKQVIPR